VNGAFDSILYIRPCPTRPSKFGSFLASVAYIAPEILVGGCGGVWSGLAISRTVGPFLNVIRSIPK
jgi:hypothetical protein